MLLVGSAGSMTFYLQAYKIFSNESATNVSLAAFLFGLISVTSWLIYGFLQQDKPLIISNIFAVVGALLTVIAILIYSK